MASDMNCDNSSQVGDTTGKVHTPSNAPKAAQFSKSSLVTIIVGQGWDVESFTVHEDLLIAYSAFFKSCLDSHFEEAIKKRVELPEDEPRDFEAVVNWLYHGTTTIEDDISHSAVFRMMTAYKLADKLIMPKLKNHLVDSIRELLRERNIFLSLEDISVHCQSNIKGDKLYDLTLKLFVWVLHNSAETIKLEPTIEAGAFANVVLVQDLVTMVRDYNLQAWEDPTTLVGCHWHDHSDRSACEFADFEPPRLPSTSHGGNKARRLGRRNGRWC